MQMKESVEERSVEEIIDIPVSHVMEETIDAVEYDPLIREQIGEVIQFIPREQISESIDEQTVDVSVLEIREQSVGVVMAIPLERLRQRTVEQSVIICLVLRLVLKLWEVLKPFHRNEIWSESVNRLLMFQCRVYQKTSSKCWRSVV